MIGTLSDVLEWAKDRPARGPVEADVRFPFSRLRSKWEKVPDRADEGSSAQPIHPFTE
jgi:hypothetical protein